ncbi:hypothetical protein [Actinoallomurus sp. CA-142502]
MNLVESPDASGMLLPVRLAAGPPSVWRRVLARFATISSSSLVLVTK